MSAPDHDEKARNREIARNEEQRKAIGAIRVSSWAIAIAVILGLIAFGFAWAWMHR